MPKPFNLHVYPIKRPALPAPKHVAPSAPTPYHCTPSSRSAGAWPPPRAYASPAQTITVGSTPPRRPLMATSPIRRPSTSGRPSQGKSRLLENRHHTCHCTGHTRSRRRPGRSPASALHANACPTDPHRSLQRFTMTPSLPFSTSRLTARHGVRCGGDGGSYRAAASASDAMHQHLPTNAYGLTPTPSRRLVNAVARPAQIVAVPPIDIEQGTFRTTQ